ncbi:hypothetical protein DdX_07735 [Ditylenchus destructor]|uniref:Uncharacterized protein n=1 Tax=Ditylenchus destructor TaxID=166010 RepID=A0AAD4N7G8_9BILA|nr:hypothetical protein DdX_07735 [Ditylenchus destructor]
MPQEEITALHGSVRVLEELIKSQEVVFETLRYKAQKLQEELNQCKVRYSSTDEGFQPSVLLQNEILESMTIYSKMKMRIATLKTELTSLDTTCNRLSSDHHTAMTQLERVSHAQALASEELQKKTRELNDALEICAYKEEKLDEKQAIIENFEKTMSDKDYEIQLLTQENRTMLEENEDIKTKLPKTLQKHKEKFALPARGIKPATGADRAKTSTADPKDRTKNAKADASFTKSKSSSTKNDERNLQEAAIEPNPRLLQGHYGVEAQLNSQSSTKSTKTLHSTSNDTPKPGNATKPKKKWRLVGCFSPARVRKHP